MSTESAPRFESNERNPFTFESFANKREYQKVNRELIKTAIKFLPQTLNPLAIVDVASGTGLATKLYKEELQESGKKAKIIGVDPNRDSLKVANRSVLSSPNVSVEFIEGFGQDLDTLLKDKFPEGVDAASILDAIHEIPTEEDKRKVLKSMAGMLKLNGILFLNSAFTSDGMEPQTVAWGKWKLTAFNQLGEKQDPSITAIKLHTPEEYKEMLTSLGLEIIHEEKKEVELSLNALIAISLYPGFIDGVYRDMQNQEKFSFSRKSGALIEALARRRTKSLKRTWYEVMAQKKAA